MTSKENCLQPPQAIGVRLERSLSLTPLALVIVTIPLQAKKQKMLCIAQQPVSCFTPMKARELFLPSGPQACLPRCSVLEDRKEYRYFPMSGILSIQDYPRQQQDSIRL